MTAYEKLLDEPERMDQLVQALNETDERRWRNLPSLVGKDRYVILMWVRALSEDAGE